MTMLDKVTIAIQNSFDSNDIKWSVLQSMAKAAIEAIDVELEVAQRIDAMEQSK